MSDLPAVLGGEPLFPNGPPSWPMKNSGVDTALAAAARDGSWGQYHGGHCEQLREDLKTWAGCEQVELCSSGTAASELALRAFKVGPGDEVILAAYDYAASFKNVLMLGAVPVLVDNDPQTLSIRIDQIDDAITERTKAIVVSHLHGGIVDMLAVMEIANRHGLPVLEDACQATGGSLSDQRLGSFGTLGIISFGGSKLITAGRGGAIVGNDEQLFQRMHLHSFRGNTAYPLSELQAAVLIPQLAELDSYNATRGERVEQLRTGLADAHLTIVSVPADATAAWYKVGMVLSNELMDARDRIAMALRTEGIACDRGLHGLHTVHSKRRFRAIGDLTGSTAINDLCLQLHHPILLGDSVAANKLTQGFQRVLNHWPALSES